MPGCLPRAVGWAAAVAVLLLAAAAMAATPPQALQPLGPLGSVGGDAVARMSTEDLSHCSADERGACAADRDSTYSRPDGAAPSGGAPLIPFADFAFASSDLTARLPIDPLEDNNVRQVRGAVFSRVQPTGIGKLAVAAVSAQALAEVMRVDGGDPALLSSEAFAALASGTALWPGSTPLAHCYGGHQFGHWAGQLGDGRAILLGEAARSSGGGDMLAARWQLQLKGSGLTPYSRRGDGRAVLRSSVREFLASEAMHHLGVPTSRALSLVVGDERVVRDPFYNGRPRYEPTAVVLRAAETWFRFGSFEIFHERRDVKTLTTLADYIVDTHFPDLQAAPRKYLGLLQRIVASTAHLLASWMAVGFAHGVMNTDNFSILGLSIDFGPFGFLDAADPAFVPNSSDDEGMYTFGKQPEVAHANLQRLATALSLLIQDPEGAAAAVAAYWPAYHAAHLKAFGAKLGLPNPTEKDAPLIQELLEIMASTGADYSKSFYELRFLVDPSLPNADQAWATSTLARSAERWAVWRSDYMTRIQPLPPSEVVAVQSAANPRYVLRNYMAEHAIRLAHKGDFSEVRRLLRVLSAPYTTQGEAEEAGYANPPPTWAGGLKVSCSS